VKAANAFAGFAGFQERFRKNGLDRVESVH
jgi:hypothetical protein